MITKFSRINSLILLLLLTPCLIYGYTISGSVKDPSSINLSGFTVKATNSVTGSSYSGISAANGTYSITDVPSGTYALTVMNSTDYNVSPSFTNPFSVNANLSGRNFILSGKAQPSVRLVAPPNFTPGQSFTVTAYIKNTGSATSTLIGYLDVSFPDNPGITVTSSSSEFGTPEIHPAGSGIYSSTGTPMTSSYILMSAVWRGLIQNQVEKSVTLSVTPPANATSIKIRYRGTIADKHDPTSGTKDQQGWYIKEQTVTSASYKISGSLKYPDNYPIGGFIIRATNRDNSSLTYSSGESDYSTGAYSISNLPAGSYTLAVLNTTDYTVTNTFNSLVTITSANISGRNFTLAGKAQPSVRLVAPPNFTPGQPFTITAYIKNTGTATSTLIGYLDVSFPENPGITVTSSSGEFGTPEIHPAGSGIYSSSGNSMTSSHILMSAVWRGLIQNQVEKSVTLSVTPPANATSIKIRYRGTIADKHDPTSGTTDQQGWYVKEQTVTSASYTISGSLKYPDNYPVGGFIIRATNRDNSSLTYSSGESDYSTGAYSISNLPAGSYTLAVLNTNDYTVTNTFNSLVTITSANISGRNFTLAGKAQPSVRLVAPPNFTPGQPFTITAYIKNTGTATSTLIGYLDVSFPENPGITVTSSSSEFGTPEIHPAGSGIYSSTGNSMTSSHILMSALWRGLIQNQVEKSVTLSVTPPANATSIKIRYRGTIADKHDPTSGATDQQGWYAKEMVIPGSANIIQTLYGDVFRSWTVSLFGNKYKVFAFKKQGAASDEVICLPFLSDSNTPILTNFIEDNQLAEVVLQRYYFNYMTDGNYADLNVLKNSVFVELAKFYDLDKWWYSDDHYLPAFKRRTDHVILGKISFSLANEVVKAKLTGGRSMLGLINSVLSPLANSGELEGINNNEIQGLIMAQSLYNGSISEYQDKPVLVKNFEYFSRLKFFLSNVSYAKDIGELSQHSNAILIAAKNANITDLLINRNKLSLATKEIAGGLIYDGITDLLFDITGLDDLSKEIDVYAWLSDAHFDAIYAVTHDCIDLVNAIENMEKNPYSPENCEKLLTGYHDIISKYSMIIKSLQAELVALQLRRLTYIRNRFVGGVTDLLGANNKNINELKSDYEFFVSDYNDHQLLYTNYMTDVLTNFASYEGAYEILTNRLSENNLSFTYIQDNSALVLGQAKTIQFKLTNNYLWPVTISDFTFNDNSGYLTYSASIQPITLQPATSQTVSVNITVPRNYFWLNATVPNLIDQTETNIETTWSVSGQTFSRIFNMKHIITSFARIESISPLKGIYRPGDNIAISMKCSGTGGLSGIMYSQALLKPDGTKEGIQIFSLPANGIANFQKTAPNGPFGAYGFYGLLMQNSDVIVPTVYANKLFYLVPAINFDMHDFEWSGCMIVYPEADLSAATDLKNIIGLSDNSFLKIEDYTTAELKSKTQSHDVILVGGHMANPLVSELDHTSLSKPGDAIIKYFPDAFSNQSAIVIAGWELRDTEIAVLGLMDEYKKLSNSIHGKLVYNNTLKTPLQNVSLNLFDSENKLSDTFISDGNGEFTFEGVKDGNYLIKPGISNLWGGVSSMDLTAYKKHLAGISPLTPLQVRSGDVNGSGGLTVMDLTFITQRIGAKIGSFLAGDWVWSDATVTVNGSDVNKEISFLCTGDANGSYAPSSLKSTSDIIIPVELELSGTRPDEYDIPFRVNQPVTNLASITLELTYSQKYIDIIDVSIPGNDEDLYYTTANGVLRIIFSTLNPLSLNQNEQLLSLKVRLNPTTMDEPQNLINLAAKGEFGDFNGNVLNDLMLFFPNRIKSGIKSEKGIILYPNPNAGRFSIMNCENGKVSVYSLHGDLVYSAFSETNKLELDLSKLPPGYYLLKVTQSDQTQYSTFSITK